MRIRQILSLLSVNLVWNYSKYTYSLPMTAIITLLLKTLVEIDRYYHMVIIMMISAREKYDRSWWGNMKRKIEKSKFKKSRNQEILSLLWPLEDGGGSGLHCLEMFPTRWLRNHFGLTWKKEAWMQSPKVDNKSITFIFTFTFTLFSEVWTIWIPSPCRATSSIGNPWIKTSNIVMSELQGKGRSPKNPKELQ